MTNDDNQIPRRELDHVFMDRLSHLEDKLDTIDELVRKELHVLDDKMESLIKRRERIMIDDATNLAVKTTFGYMGVDANDPTELEAFRNDLRFGGAIRSSITKGFFALLAAIFGGIGLSLWLSFKDQLGLK